MSLDCYPLGRRRTINLIEQPLALDVAYNDDLLISTSDQCRTINIHELSSQNNEATLYRSISLGQDIVLDQVVYCRTGDYLAFIGDKNGTTSVYVVIGWRKEQPKIIVLNLNKAARKTKSEKPSHLNSIDCCQQTGNLAVSNGELILIYHQQGDKQEFEHIISVRLAISALKICLLENFLAVTATDHVQVLKLELLNLQIQSEGLDGCITWNLNTKKLVKLPTLMHNTSSDLSSYYICHPLELLGPASESIACRVSASIYSPDFSQNQLEAIVMLCKQFDFDRDPVKSTLLHAVYLSSLEDQGRISRSASALMDLDDSGCDQASLCSGSEAATLLKSSEYELLASVSCFVSTLANCYVYSLLGKKVVCSQRITYPDLCLDLRPDLLNVYLLTPLGLQICSSGICDSTFRYDWSSSSDLNLSFIATDRIRVLTTRRFVILIACSVDGHECEVEYFEKPDLYELLDRIVDTVNHCNSISIRANMLTYLHASSHLALIASNLSCEKATTCAAGQTIPPNKQQQLEKKHSIVSNLKSITIMLCKQLLQKRQTNAITNNRIDKAIKHLLDISMCDLSELMRRHMQPQQQQREELFNFMVEDDPDKPLDANYELVSIYLKHSKYSQRLSDYLVSISQDENMIRRVIDYVFEHNPGLLIKCAQRYPLFEGDENDDDDHDDNNADHQVAPSSVASSVSTSSAAPAAAAAAATGCGRTAFCMGILVEKLEQLVEFDSTGINRATVLFTLAALYNALEDRQKCLAALGRIKPLNHLAITMCTDYELSLSIAGLVSENYPDVYALYLKELSKRDRFAKSMQHLQQERETTSGSNSILLI